MNIGTIRRIGLPCCALLLTASSASLVKADPGGQDALQAALARVDKVSSQLDAATQKNLPHIKEIVTRVCLHPDSATPTEKKIAQPFLSNTRSLFDDIAQKAAAAQVKTAVQNATSATIEFVAAQDTVPGGQTKGIVYLKNPDLPERKAIVEIPSGTVQWPVEKRAEVVAKRLEAAHNADPLWWTNLEVHQIKKQVVVAVKGSQDAYVITADKEFAKLQGVTPETLAFNLVDQIRSTIDPNTTRGLKTDAQMTPREKLAHANTLRESGDDAYSAKDLAGAEEAYIRAIKYAPAYVVPYLRLADLYVEKKQVGDAKDILHQAQSAIGMTTADKTLIAKKITALGASS